MRRFVFAILGVWTFFLLNFSSFADGFIKHFGIKAGGAIPAGYMDMAFFGNVYFEFRPSLPIREVTVEDYYSTKSDVTHNVFSIHTNLASHFLSISKFLFWLKGGPSVNFIHSRIDLDEFGSFEKSETKFRGNCNLGVERELFPQILVFAEVRNTIPSNLLIDFVSLGVDFRCK